MITRNEAEEFLFEEAALLDEWRLKEWLELMAPDAVYLIPALDAPQAEAAHSLYMVADDRKRLESRISQLLGRNNWSENPHSRTRRLVSNVRVVAVHEAEAEITANFAIWRFRNGASDNFVGRYAYRVVREGNRFLIRERKAVLDMEALRPQGKISFII